MRLSFAPTANLMAMYASAKTGKQHSPEEFMPKAIRKAKPNDGVDASVYHKWAKAAGVNVGGA